MKNIYYRMNFFETPGPGPGKTALNVLDDSIKILILICYFLKTISMGRTVAKMPACKNFLNKMGNIFLEEISGPDDQAFMAVLDSA